jgi:hypothetical protein
MFYRLGHSLLVALLPLSALSAQTLTPGYTAPTGPNVGGNVIRELSDGTLVTSDGNVVERWTAGGVLIGQIGAFSAPGDISLLVVDPSETFVLAGGKTTGEVLRVDLGGAGQTQLGFIPGNVDAAFDGPVKAVVSAYQCLSGPACGVALLRLDTSTGAVEAIASVSGDAGPVAYDGAGNLFYGTRAKAPIPSGSDTLLRFAAALLAAPPTPAYQALDDLVVIEVESVPPAGDWKEYTAPVGFTGKSFYRWDGPDHFSSPGFGILKYEFEVQKATNYKFRIHNRHDNPVPDQSNDCWVRIDGGVWNKVFSNQGTLTVGAWNWVSVIETSSGLQYEANYDLSAGRHTVEISGRSNGYMADRLIFFPIEIVYAHDLNNPESVFAQYNATHAYPFATGLTGALELIHEPETASLFLAEYAPNLGLNRIRRFAPSGSAKTLVEGVPFQRTRNLSFRFQPGAGQFLPYQPTGNGTLGFTHQQDGVVNDRRILTPLRPALTVSGPGTVTGSGVVDLALANGPPSGHAFVLWAPAGTVGPEVALYLPGMPPLYTGFWPTATKLIPVPLPFDPSGKAGVTFVNGLGAPGLVALQSVVVSATGVIRATSTPALL